MRRLATLLEIRMMLREHPFKVERLGVGDAILCAPLDRDSPGLAMPPHEKERLPSGEECADHALPVRFIVLPCYAMSLERLSAEVKVAISPRVL